MMQPRNISFSLLLFLLAVIFFVSCKNSGSALDGFWLSQKSNHIAFIQHETLIRNMNPECLRIKISDIKNGSINFSRECKYGINGVDDELQFISSPTEMLFEGRDTFYKVRLNNYEEFDQSYALKLELFNGSPWFPYNIICATKDGEFRLDNKNGKPNKQLWQLLKIVDFKSLEQYYVDDFIAMDQFFIKLSVIFIDGKTKIITVGNLQSAPEELQFVILYLLSTALLN